MPAAPPRPCTQPGCGRYAVTAGRCADHKREAWVRPAHETAHARGYGSRWRKLRLLVMRRDQYLCQTCLTTGRHTTATEVDHVTPKSAGGSDDPANLVAICHACHITKTLRERANRQGGVEK